ncbi:MAG: ABC transporter ATP-binding protein [Spirochaetes bacterium]|nr:ABC transporter ATP-binding protein [Spirochaetota bacterium]
MVDITKRFVDVVANDKVSFSLFPNEVCALLGENGAGKTTLMNILFGYYLCDSGEIRIYGRIVRLGSPKDAIAHGISMIHQHFTLVPSQSVLENAMIGVEGGFFLDKKKARKRLLEIEKQFGLDLDPDAMAFTLTIGQQQKLEILKALYREAKILIMDEPTAVLAPIETRELFATLRTLVDNGRSVVFISHKLNEVMEISDRILVLREGKNVAERKKSETRVQELASLMVGREILESLQCSDSAAGNTVLQLKNLRVRNSKGVVALDGFSLDLREREIVGIAGVSGNGQTELSELLFGIRRPEEGSIVLDGKEVPGGSPSAMIRAGMARIPEDRISTGVCMDLSVMDNMILVDHCREPFSKLGLINGREIRSWVLDRVRDFQVKTDGVDAPVKSLSGGNLQKVILARELAGQPKIIIACQPTRGLDVGAMEYVHQAILRQKERGAGILLISDDLDEVLLLCDRVIVIYEGRIMGELCSDGIDRERIGLWMSGVA